MPAAALLEDKQFIWTQSSECILLNTCNLMVVSSGKVIWHRKLKFRECICALMIGVCRTIREILKKLILLASESCCQACSWDDSKTCRQVCFNSGSNFRNHSGIEYGLSISQLQLCHGTYLLEPIKKNTSWHVLHTTVNTHYKWETSCPLEPPKSAYTVYLVAVGLRGKFLVSCFV